MERTWRGEPSQKWFMENSKSCKESRLTILDPGCALAGVESIPAQISYFSWTSIHGPLMNHSWTTHEFNWKWAQLFVSRLPGLYWGMLWGFLYANLSLSLNDHSWHTHDSLMNQAWTILSNLLFLFVYTYILYIYIYIFVYIYMYIFIWMSRFVARV